MMRKLVKFQLFASVGKQPLCKFNRQKMRMSVTDSQNAYFLISSSYLASLCTLKFLTFLITLNRINSLKSNFNLVWIRKRVILINCKKFFSYIQQIIKFQAIKPSNNFTYYLNDLIVSCDWLRASHFIFDICIAGQINSHVFVTVSNI